MLAAEQIAAALAAHPAPVTVYVPHYAMSGGDADRPGGRSDRHESLGGARPGRPQVGDLPAASILAAVAQTDVNEIDDRTLILADVGRKAQRQVREFVTGLLGRHHAPERAAEIASVLSEGRWTHDFPIDADRARELGLPVSTDLPDEVRQLMSLYPQPRGRRPSGVHPHPVRADHTSEQAAPAPAGLT